MRHKKFEEVLKEALKDPEFKKEWEATEVHYQVVSAIIGQRIKHKMSQAELAKKAGLKQPSIARVESGSVMPSIVTLGKIAKAFGAKLEVRFQDSP